MNEQKIVYVAIVTIVIDDPLVNNEASACDWMSGLLSQNEGNGVLDWSYLRVGPYYLMPSPTLVDKEYSEGSIFGLEGSAKG